MTVKTRKQRIREIEKAYYRGENAYVVELAEQYLQDHPDSELALFFCGRSLLEFHRYTEAENVFRKEIEVTEPESRQRSYANMGALCEKRGEYRQAEEWYRKANRLDPDEAGYLIFIGVMHFRDGKLAQAEQSLRASLLCKEGCFDEAYYNLGVVLAASGRYEEAIECYEKAIAIDPKYRVAKLGLKDAQKALEARNDGRS
jgi:tetratricopeptide (TPR) repeat protein